jgi:MFS family permease
MGISIGPFSLTPCTFADLVPPEMLAPAMSLLTFWEGIALFLGPLVGGIIYDYSKR